MILLIKRYRHYRTKSTSDICELTCSFTKAPWYHGLVAGYILQPITVHYTEVLRNLIGWSKVADHETMMPWFPETV